VRNSDIALNTAFSTDTEKSVPIPAGRHATVNNTIYMGTASEAQVSLHTSPLPNQGLYGYRPTPFPTNHQFISSWRDLDDDVLRCETPVSAKYYAALQ
jgi:hypothetical protein